MWDNLLKLVLVCVRWLLDEEQFNKQLQSISLSKEEFVDVDHKNIDSLLDTNQDTDYCSDSNFEFSV